jgi:hypothetical protein
MTVAGAELRSPLALAVITLLCGLGDAGCASDVLPTSPDSIRSGALSADDAQGSVQLGEPSGSSRTGAQPSDNFDLVGGIFRVTTVNGDQLTGTYSGQATVSASRLATALLELRVVEGSGVFQGASGTLRGVGTGEFTGEGAFSLSLKGSLSLAAKPGASRFQTNIVGVASIACVSGQTYITLQSDATSNRFGRVSEVLSHQVANAGCSF